MESVLPPQGELPRSYYARIIQRTSERVVAPGRLTFPLICHKRSIMGRGGGVCDIFLA